MPKTKTLPRMLALRSLNSCLESQLLGTSWLRNFRGVGLAVCRGRRRRQVRQQAGLARPCTQRPPETGVILVLGFSQSPAVRISCNIVRLAGTWAPVLWAFPCVIVDLKGLSAYNPESSQNCDDMGTRIYQQIQGFKTYRPKRFQVCLWSQKLQRDLPALREAPRCHRSRRLKSRALMGMAAELHFQHPSRGPNAILLGSSSKGNHKRHMQIGCTGPLLMTEPSMLEKVTLLLATARSTASIAA